MTLSEKMQEYQNICMEVEAICVSNTSAENKYNLIFSNSICGKLHELEMFPDYSDPDTTYQEDIDAFADALQREFNDYKSVIVNLRQRCL